VLCALTALQGFFGCGFFVFCFLFFWRICCILSGKDLWKKQGNRGTKEPEEGAGIYLSLKIMKRGRRLGCQLKKYGFIEEKVIVKKTKNILLY